MSTVRWAREVELALVFHVLAHLDLGRDAASIFDETRAILATSLHSFGALATPETPS